MADAAYLQEKVGPALSAGLASCAAAQPDDPVEYLAHWLLKYLAIEEKRMKAAEAQEMIKAEKEALESAETAKANAKEEKFFIVKRAMEEMSQSTSIKQMFNLMVKAARETGNASNVYLMLFEQRPPPDGQQEDPEPEPPAPPEPVDGAEPAPVEKLDPYTPKFSVLKCIGANPENSWLVGKEIKSPALGKQQTVSYKAVETREPQFLWNVMESDPAIVFHDMPMPGSFAAVPILKGEDEKYKAGGLLGVLCADTVGGSGAILTEEDKEILMEMSRTAGATYERLKVEERARKAEEDEVVRKLIEEDLVVAEGEEAKDEDDVDTLEAKLDVFNNGQIAKAKSLIKERLPKVKASEHGRSVAEFKEFQKGSDSERVGAAVCALVEGSVEELDEKIANFNIKTVKEDALKACAAALGEGLTPQTASVEFPGQVLLALIHFVQKLADTSLKAQKIRMEQEEARLAELEKERLAAEEAAAAEAAPPAES